MSPNNNSARKSVLLLMAYAKITLPIYRQFSNISRTKSSNLNVSRLVLQLSLPDPLNPDAMSGMKM